jgi:hypothetical protein
MAELKNQGLYIVKTYVKNNGKILPVLKFGYTKNISLRLKHYGSNYKLIKFYLCSYPEWRERYIKEYWFNEDFRLSKNEHFIFETGLLKIMNESILDACSFKLRKNKCGWIENINDYE